jgi:hypothetical protein
MKSLEEENARLKKMYACKPSAKSGQEIVVMFMG